MSEWTLVASFRNVIKPSLARQREWERRAKTARAMLTNFKLARVPSATHVGARTRESKLDMAPFESP